MYHPPSKKQQLIRRTITYSLMSLSVALLVAILLFVLLGYQYNRSDGTLRQGGLLQFISAPSGASVKVNDQTLGSQTPTKLTTSAGQHAVVVTRDGYRPWQKTVQLHAGSVLWLNYIRLIPTTPKTSSVADFASLSGALGSGEGNYFAFIENPSAAKVTIAATGSDTVRITALTLPETSYTRPTGTDAASASVFTLEQWDESERYLLLKHVYDQTKVEWIVLDRDNVNDTHNLTTLFNIPIAKAQFNPSNSRQIFTLSGGDIRRADLGNETLTRTFVSSVADFSVYERDLIGYTTLPDANGARSVGYYRDGTEKPYVLREVASSTTSLHVALSEYFGETYVAIADDTRTDILKGTLPNASEPAALKVVATMDLPGGVQWLTRNENGRFVIVQNQGTLMTYDLELARASTVQLAETTATTRPQRWIDNYMFWSDGAGILRTYEFDGANQQDIMGVAPGFDVRLSPSGKYIYGVSKTDAGYSLQRAQLLP